MDVRKVVGSMEQDTPKCLFYSRGGLIPHLTMDNFHTIVCEGVESIWHIPLSTIYEQPGCDVLSKYGKSFHNFCNLKNQILILNTNDSFQLKEEIYKYNEEKSISIWAPGGRRKITPEEYMIFLEVFQFDVCIPPSDTVPGGLARKRCQKSCDRTVRFVDRCLQIKKEKNLNVPMFGCIEGGDSIPYRQKCAKEMRQRNIDGYVLSGFDIIGENWLEVLKETIVYIKDDKLKMMFGVFNPNEVIEAVRCGVDIFDSVICYQATQRGCALSFPLLPLLHEDLNNIQPVKKKKQDGEEKLSIFQKDLAKYELNLHESIFFDDVGALVHGCTCYCCSRYTRSYLHHLLVTKEMLAEVLLMLHNLHHWCQFFKILSKYKADNKLDELDKIVLNI